VQAVAGAAPEPGAFRRDGRVSSPVMATPLAPETGLGGPALTLAVCTRDRAALLRGCLESLAQQDVDPARVELLVVDNASRDETAEVCRDVAGRRPGLRLRRVREPEPGLARARNRALAEARAPLVTFVDDDALASPGLARAVLAFFERVPGAAAVGGRVIPVFEEDPPPWYNRFSAPLFFSRHELGDRPFRHGRRSYPVGCNMTLRRSRALGLGGFRTDLGRGAGAGLGAEEKELFARMHARGDALYHDPEQRVHHRIPAARTRPPRTTELARGLGRSQRRLYCARGTGPACLVAGIDMVARLGAATLLALGYALRGRPAVSRHLVWFRWQALRGFLERAGTTAADAGAGAPGRPT